MAHIIAMLTRPRILLTHHGGASGLWKMWSAVSQPLLYTGVLASSVPLTLAIVTASHSPNSGDVSLNVVPRHQSTLLSP